MLLCDNRGHGVFTDPNTGSTCTGIFVNPENPEKRCNKKSTKGMPHKLAVFKIRETRDSPIWTIVVRNFVRGKETIESGYYYKGTIDENNRFSGSYMFRKVKKDGRYKDIQVGYAYRGVIDEQTGKFSGIGTRQDEYGKFEGLLKEDRLFRGRFSDLDDGSYYEGEFNQEDEPHGKGKFVDCNGRTIYEGDFANGIPVEDNFSSRLT